MSKRSQQGLKQQIAIEAARILNELGYVDYPGAIRKAAQHLKVRDARQLPTAAEVELALREYQQLFSSDNRLTALQEQRQAALGLMRQLADFQPRLVGPLADGTAGPNSRIRLRLRAETPEDVAIRLLNLNWGYRADEDALHIGNQDWVQVPVFRLRYQETPAELSILPVRLWRRPILGNDGGAEAGLNTEQLSQLLQTTPA